MDLIHGIRTKHHSHKVMNLYKDGIDLSANNTQFLIIRLPDYWVLKLVIRLVLLALADRQVSLNSINLELLPLVFRDLENEGLLKMGDRALFVNSGNEEAIYSSQILSNNEMDLISYSDLERQSSIPGETFDFAFVHDFNAAKEFIDRTLKAMRCNSRGKEGSSKKLEDVLLEPPRAASGKSKSYHTRTRYLPDLIGDSLESYPRRVFIDVSLPENDDDSIGDAEWFAKHYPTRNKYFEMYKIEPVTEESSGTEVTPIGMSDWLKKNVREEEYVVMKAEAEMVEDMVKSNVLGLVDELFMECKHQKVSGISKKSRRAYWECLALYGRLKDDGVVVHQWWG
ncbi:hypothetical protein HYC85_020298 [Camellia sinensis]|uniref:DUF7870 domain-containing protein n=1 Tax=Camellia sinensis TaxID=4442 RepID=A0A7J7GT17_CAMSI|nr:hypothetical protein HYC85_020298 [Camellia sinensis]